MKALTKKLTKILESIGGKVQKSGWNSYQQYKYITESDLMDAVRKELGKAGIFIYTSVEDMSTREVPIKEGTTTITTVKMKYTFVDDESGESFEVYGMGEGADTQDKGINKAQTGAYKYFLMKNFMLSGNDDPENDGVTVNKPASKSTKKASSFSPNKSKEKEAEDVTVNSGFSKSKDETASEPKPSFKASNTTVREGATELEEDPEF